MRKRRKKSIESREESSSSSSESEKSSSSEESEDEIPSTSKKEGKKNTLGYDLFKTIFPGELSRYVQKDGGKKRREYLKKNPVGYYNYYMQSLPEYFDEIVPEKKWKSKNIPERISFVKNLTKGLEISTLHPLYECLEGNSLDEIRKIYMKHISTEISPSMSKEGMLLELLRTFYGQETSLEKRENESDILTEIGSLENTFRFVTFHNRYVIPNEISQQFLSFLPRNHEVIINVGSVCSVFYVLLLCSWDHVEAKKTNIASIPLTVLKNIRKLTVGDIGVSELKYIFSHTQKLRTLRVLGLWFVPHTLKNSIFSRLSMIREAKDPQILNVLDNIEVIELPKVWFSTSQRIWDPDLVLTEQFFLSTSLPKLKIVRDIYGTLKLDVFKNCTNLEEISVSLFENHVQQKFYQQFVNPTCPIPFNTIKKLSFHTDVLRLTTEQLRKVIYKLKPLEEFSLSRNEKLEKDYTPLSELLSFELEIFNHSTLVENGIHNFRKLCIFSDYQRCRVSAKESVVLQLDELHLIFPSSEDIGVRLFGEGKNNMLALSKIRRLRIRTPYLSLSMGGIVDLFVDKDRYDMNDRTYESIDLEGVNARVRFDKKLGKTSSVTSFRIASDLSAGDLEVFLKEVLENGKWVKSRLLDYVEMDFLSEERKQRVLREEDWIHGLILKHHGYVLDESVSPSSFCFEKKRKLPSPVVRNN